MVSGIREGSTIGISSVLYHKVTPEWEAGVTWVRPEKFRQQMQHLHDQGWKTVLPDGRMDGSENASPPVDRKSFVLTFDDGYECIHRYALPVLKELGYKAIVFIPSGYIGRWNDWDHHLLWRRFRHLSQRQVMDLLEAGWMVGSHTVTHRCLTELGDEEVLEELTASREALHRDFGVDAGWLAFPFGRYDSRVLKLSKAAGYSGAFAPVMRRGNRPEDFRLVRTNAVYLWDGSKAVDRILTDSEGFNPDRMLRSTTNWFSGGTLLWKKLTGR